MNSKRGFISVPPVKLGLHFDGIGALARLKLVPRRTRKMLLEAHRWTGKEALRDGIVDEVAEPEITEKRAIEIAMEHSGKAKMGVESVLRGDLWGKGWYVHGKGTLTAAKANI